MPIDKTKARLWDKEWQVLDPQWNLNCLSWRAAPHLPTHKHPASSGTLVRTAARLQETSECTPLFDAANADLWRRNAAGKPGPSRLILYPSLVESAFCLPRKPPPVSPCGAAILPA